MVGGEGEPHDKSPDGEAVFSFTYSQPRWQEGTTPTTIPQEEPVTLSPLTHPLPCPSAQRCVMEDRAMPSCLQPRDFPKGRENSCLGNF